MWRLFFVFNSFVGGGGAFVGARLHDNCAKKGIFYAGTYGTYLFSVYISSRGNFDFSVDTINLSNGVGIQISVRYLPYHRSSVFTKRNLSSCALIDK